MAVVEEFKEKYGLELNTERVAQLGDMDESNLLSLPLQKLTNLVLDCDFRKVAKGGKVPANLNSISKQTLQGSFLLQINKIENIVAPERHRLNDEYVPKKRMLRLDLTDGAVKSIIAVEHQPVPQLSANKTAPGTKILITDPVVRSGIIILKEDCVKVVGGKVDELYEGWKVNKAIAGRAGMSAAARQQKLLKKQEAGAKESTEGAKEDADEAPPAFRPIPLREQTTNKPSSGQRKGEAAAKGERDVKGQDDRSKRNNHDHGKQDAKQGKPQKAEKHGKDSHGSGNKGHGDKGAAQSGGGGQKPESASAARQGPPSNSKTRRGDGAHGGNQATLKGKGGAGKDDGRPSTAPASGSSKGKQKVVATETKAQKENDPGKGKAKEGGGKTNEKADAKQQKRPQTARDEHSSKGSQPQDKRKTEGKASQQEKAKDKKDRGGEQKPHTAPNHTGKDPSAPNNNNNNGKNNKMGSGGRQGSDKSVRSQTQPSASGDSNKAKQGRGNAKGKTDSKNNRSTPSQAGGSHQETTKNIVAELVKNLNIS